MQRSFCEVLANGCLHLAGNEETTRAGEWTPHPKFPGVRLKTLVPGSATGGALSRHMVAVDPGCRLAEHAHPGEWELHEVVAGSGIACLDGRDTHYEPGVMAVTPQGRPHSVTASDQGITLLATFFPALA